jgi:hypothetical protein
VTLGTLVGSEKFTFLYEYDFGYRCEHELLVEKILARDARKRYPSTPSTRRG